MKGCIARLRDFFLFWSLPFTSAPCGPNQFRCESGQCIDGNPRCDNHKNCSDGSDEKGCSKLDKHYNILLKTDVAMRAFAFHNGNPGSIS